MEIIWKIVFVVLLVGIFITVAHFVNLVRKSNTNNISFRETMDLCEMPIITFMNNDFKLNFILDTGANKSIIDSNIIDRLNVIKLGEKATLYGVDGNPREAEFIKLDIKHEDKYYEDEFQVLDMSVPFGKLKADFGINVHGILSSSFFQKYKYILDFDRLIAYSMA